MFGELLQKRTLASVDDGALDILANALKSLGFEIHDLTFDGDGGAPVRNIYARLGSDAPHFCYAGHTDVVPPGDEEDWRHPPF